MAYPPELLNDDEEIIVDLRPHWWFITPAAAALAAGLLLGLVVMARDVWEFVSILVGVGVLAALGFFAVRYSQWMTTNFVVTTDRVIWRVGVFAKKGTEIPVEKINAVHFEQRILERIIGLGTLRIESAAESGASQFDDIRKPSAVQNLIHQQMDSHDQRDFERRAANIASTGVAPSIGIPEQIEQLNQLRKQGAITEAEYDAKKADLLKRM